MRGRTVTDADPRPDGNQRYLLRAYETPDAARLAMILRLANAPELSRRRIADLWITHRPADAVPGQFRTVRGRIGRGASLLETAGGVRRHLDLIQITNWDVIHMAARNLEILETPGGMALPPHRWSRRPEAPAFLHPIQEQLERGRAAAAQRTNP